MWHWPFDELTTQHIGVAVVAVLSAVAAALTAHKRRR